MTPTTTAQAITDSQAAEVREWGFLRVIDCSFFISGEPGNADLTDRYRETGVRMIRTHDDYGPLDMATMYRIVLSFVQ